MIKFSNWSIKANGPILCRQNDNKTHTVEVVGEIPEGWSWYLLLGYDSKKNSIRMTQDVNGLRVTLEATMVPFAGLYKVELLAVDGERKKHTNILLTNVPHTLSQDSDWPEIPTEFVQTEERIREMYEHPPIPGENGYWMLWDPELGQYLESDIPLPSVAPGSGNVSSSEIKTIKVLDRSEYESLETKDKRTLYLIRG